MLQDAKHLASLNISIPSWGMRGKLRENELTAKLDKSTDKQKYCLEKLS